MGVPWSSFSRVSSVSASEQDYDMNAMRFECMYSLSTPLRQKSFLAGQNSSQKALCVAVCENNIRGSLRFSRYSNFVVNGPQYIQLVKNK